MADDAKTPSELADEAHRVGQDASAAASGLASEARTIAGDSVQALRTSAADAKATAVEALDTVRGIAADAKDVAADAANTGRVYAQDAVNEVGKRIVSFRERAAEWQESCVKQIAAQPVKAVLIAAAGGALLAGLLLAFDRSERRYND